MPNSDSYERLQAALSENKALKSALFAASPGAILTMDHEGKLLEANAGAEEMFGFESSELIGRTLGDYLVPPEFREAHKVALLRVARGGKSALLGKRVELVAQRMDGTRFSIELAVARINLGERPVFTGFITDLTERKRQQKAAEEYQALATLEREVGMGVSVKTKAEDMLQHCCELLVAHLGASFARIWTLESKGRVLQLKASAGLYTHLDGKHSRIPVGKFKIGRIAKSQKPHLTNKVVGDSQVHDQEWAEREGMVAFAGYPLIVEGRTVGVMAAFAKHELSSSALRSMGSIANPIAIGIERKRIEDDLRRFAEVLQEADRRKNEFLATLGHELRNPIQIVGHCAERLALQTPDEPELRTVTKQVEHLKRLVDDILEISSMMLGRIKLVRQHLSMAACVREAVEAMRLQVEGRQQELEFIASDDEECHVYADEARLVQVATNLIANASKYSPEGSRIQVRLTTEVGQVVLTVTDEGIGIAHEFMSHIFEMFSQAAPSTHSSGGMGLGLPLVRRIVEDHGGSIRASSAGLGKGSTFTVRLESVELEEPEQPAESQVVTVTQSVRRVLVVDDNVDAAESLARLIPLLGEHEVEVAFDGQAALACAEREPPDLVLLDVNLPGMTGYEVAQKLRTMPNCKHTKLVALTGFGRPEDAQRSLSAGIDLHLVKPLERHRLVDLLEGRFKS